MFSLFGLQQFINKHKIKNKKFSVVMSFDKTIVDPVTGADTRGAV